MHWPPVFLKDSSSGQFQKLRHNLAPKVLFAQDSNKGRHRSSTEPDYEPIRPLLESGQLLCRPGHAPQVSRDKKDQAAGAQELIIAGRPDRLLLGWKGPKELQILCHAPNRRRSGETQRSSSSVVRHCSNRPPRCPIALQDHR